MAAGDVQSGPLVDPSGATTLITSKTLLPQHRFPLKDWRPRDGRSVTYEEWELGIYRLCKALGIAYEDIGNGPPTTQHATAQTPQSPNPYSPFQSEEQGADLATWQKLNTSLYWHVLPSLKLDGHESQLIAPFTHNAKAMYFHYFSDANLKEGSVSGGIGMLAGGPIVGLSQRQHHTAPESHTAEIVAAGVNVNQCIPVNGLLQELRIRLGRATPFYLDSKTSVFVSNSDAAVKKSVWLLRRVKVISEVTAAGEIVTIHIPEANMVADPFTKYLPYAVWSRHMRYALNTNAPGAHGNGTVSWDVA